MLIILGFLFVSGCSQKAATPTKSVASNSPKNRSVEVTPSNFVPEHIRRSHIEVVEH